jgi:hypothetical protein
MNWRRGLLRAWSVIAICWIGAIGGHGSYKWYNDPWRVVSVKPLRAECYEANPPQWCLDPEKTKPPFNPFDKFDVLPDVPLEPSLWFVLFLSVVPPAALLLFGAALYWVGQGFRSRDT